MSQKDTKQHEEVNYYDGEAQEHMFLHHLHKQRNGLQVGDLCSVDGISGQDVQGSCAALHNLLHPHSILTTKDEKSRC